MKKIKLMHVISNLETGGAQVLLGQLIEQLHKEGTYQQVVVTFKPGNYQATMVSLGVPIIIITGSVSTYDPVFFMRFARVVVQERPDCMHSVLWAANFVSRLVAWYYKIPLVQSLHNNLDQNGYVRRTLDRLFSFYKTPVVAVSDGIVRSLDTYAPWMKKHALVVIKNGLALQDLEQKSSAHTVTHAELGLSEKHVVIGSVGRFEAVKNYALLLTAFALLYDEYPQARLVLVGYGSQEQFLRKRAFDLGISSRVVFVINQPGYKYYRLFDLFTLSSYKEGISLALLEAMGLGRPVVITNCEYEHDVVQHERNGLIVPSNDPQALADALAFYIKKPEVAAAYGAQALCTVRDSFDSTYMTEKYSYLYKKTIAASLSVAK